MGFVELSYWINSISFANRVSYLLQFVMIFNYSGEV